MTLLTVLAPTAAQQQIPTLWQGSDIRIAVEVAFRSNPLADVLLWEDITDYVREIQITRGRSGELDRFQPSTAAITVASTGRDFDPEYTSGPWYGYILPNRAVRVRVQYDAGAGLVEYFVWQGFVDEWPQDYAGISAAEVTIPCSDAFAWLSAIPFDSPFAGEVSLDLSGSSAPTAWYRLGDPDGSTTAVDTVGGNHGTYEGGLTGGAGALIATSSDTAVTFGPSGGTPRVSITTTPVVASAPFALEFMHEGAAPGNANYWFRCASANTGTPSSDVYVQANQSTTALTFGVKSGGEQCIKAYSVPTLYDGNAHHVLVGIDSAGEPRCYVDGTQASELDGYNTYFRFMGALGSMPYAAIGNSQFSSPSNCIAATIDEFIVWDGVFPSESRIAAHVAAALTGWTGDTTAELAGRVLDAVGWPGTYQDIGTGSTVGSGEGLSGTAYDVLMILNDTEGGQCYVDGQGRIVFRGRTEMASDTRSAVSQAVFGDV